MANDGNSYAGIAVGAAVLAGTVAVGSVSGGIFNPAAGMLPWVFDTGTDVWLYWAGPCIGAVAAALLVRMTAREYGELPFTAFP